MALEISPRTFDIFFLRVRGGCGSILNAQMLVIGVVEFYFLLELRISITGCKEIILRCFYKGCRVGGFCLKFRKGLKSSSPDCLDLQCLLIVSVRGP